MSLSELRTELKSLRKSMNPVPTSRMKKADVAMEIARLKGLHHTEVKKVEEDKPPSGGEVPKKTAKKVKAVQEVEHKKQEETVKKTKGVKSSGAPAEVKVPTTESKPAKPAKGSEEMKARMAALRAKRAEKKAE